MRSDLSNSSRYTAVLYFLGRYNRLFIAIFLLTLLSSVMESVSVVAFFPIFSSLLNSSQEEAGGILRFMTRMADLFPFGGPIVRASVLLIVVFLTKTFFTLLREFVTAYTSAKVNYDVKKGIMGRYASAHYQYILDNPQGTLLFGVIGAPGAVSGIIQTGSQMATSLLKVLTITIVLISILPYGALALALVAVAYYAGMHYLSNKVSFHLGVRGVEANTGQNIVANEFLNGFHQIIVFNAAKWWISKFDRESRILKDIQLKNSIWQAVPRPVMELAGLALMLGLILAIWLSSSGTLAGSLPKIGIFAVALAQLMPPLTTFGTMRLAMMSLLPTLEMVYQLLTGPVPTRRDGDRVLKSFERAIVFENVTFAYKNRDLLFNGVNLSFGKGEVTAIVGPSGAGKTSTVNLILGLFEPDSGRVTVDGIPLQDIKQESWLSKIGFVSQEPFTYHASVADNILLGRGDRSRESVINSAEIANAHEFVSQLPQGYDTVVGERGMKVSGGQQQRLAIARALLDSPDILIFDEATSSLDNISEKAVQQAIDNVSSNRTVIIIAHRLSTIRHADKIIVLDRGRVVEEGTHQELLDRQGHYSRLAGSVR